MLSYFVVGSFSYLIHSVYSGWVLALQEAGKGDREQMMLVSQMLSSGYGCKPNAQEAKRWLTKCKLAELSVS